MSYEYKEEILLDIGPEPNCNYGSEYDRYYDKIEELEHVYAQAALNKEEIKQIEETYKVRYSEHIELKRRAEEYEAKAKAWYKYKAHMESHIAGEINEEELVSDLKSDYFESGDLE